MKNILRPPENYETQATAPFSQFFLQYFKAFLIRNVYALPKRIKSNQLPSPLPYSRNFSCNILKLFDQKCLRPPKKYETQATAISSVLFSHYFAQYFKAF